MTQKVERRLLIDDYVWETLFKCAEHLNVKSPEDTIERLAMLYYNTFVIKRVPWK